jgi:hypothetical protein
LQVVAPRPASFFHACSGRCGICAILPGGRRAPPGRRCGCCRQPGASASTARSRACPTRAAGGSGD